MKNILLLRKKKDPKKPTKKNKKVTLFGVKLRFIKIQEKNSENLDAKGCSLSFKT